MDFDAQTPLSPNEPQMSSREISPSTGDYPLDAQYRKENLHPHIRSFTSHRINLTPAQKSAYERLRNTWVVPYEDKPLDLEALFGQVRPTILEIGFGMGETTTKIALKRPDEHFIALEVFTTGVASMLKHIEENDLRNVRLIQHDAVEVLRDMFGYQSLDGIHVYFPDPWPKARHHKRRLIQSPMVRLMTSRLKIGGYLHCATDWEPYAEQMLEVLSAEPCLRNTAEGYAPKPDYRPLTKFENRGLKLGYTVHDLLFVRSR